MPGEQRVFLLHRGEDPVKHGLALADLAQVAHRHAHVVQIVDLPSEEAFHVVHPAGDLGELVREL